VPLDTLTNDNANDAEFGADWYDGIIPYHALNGEGHDDDRDGLRDEDPPGDPDGDGNPNDDNDCIDTLSSSSSNHFFGSDCFDSPGVLKFGFEELVDEDPATTNNIVRRVGDPISFTFQFFPCSPENNQSRLAPDDLTTIQLGDFCVDTLGLVMQQGFYADPANDIETTPAPAPGCPASGIVCAPEDLVFIDVTEPAFASKGEMFLQIARLDSDRSSNVTQCISDLIPIHVHRDGPNGFYHVMIDSLDLPNGTPNTDPESFSNNCDALPGAGNYAFDMLLIDSAGNKKLGIDNNNNGNFRLGWTIPETNLSDYREGVSGGTPTSLLVTILEDPLPP